MPRGTDVFVHERGLCESDDVGARTRVWAFAHVMAGAHVGADCNVGDHAFIENGAWVGDRVTIKNAVLIWDGVRIEDDAFIGPNAVFTNVVNPRSAFKPTPDLFARTRVERGASIGAGATVVAGVTIGEHGFVGAGSVVIRDVLPHAMVVGNPARRIGWMCVCGGKLDRRLRCPACSRAYRRLAKGAGLELAAGRTATPTKERSRSRR
jgi:UDP-2-acetamido-3-amino-2,3-dideoxy-glucuronate N-acetyltransferase